MASTADQLASVQALIARLESDGAQSYGEGGENFSFQNLKDLYAREKELLARQSHEDGGGFSLAQPIRD